MHYVPIYTAFVCVIILYILMRKKSALNFDLMKNRTWRIMHEAVYSLYLNLIFYPLLLFVYYLPGTINRLLTLFDYHFTPLIYFQQVFVCTHGNSSLINFFFNFNLPKTLKGIIDVSVFGFSNYVLRKQLLIWNNRLLN